MSLRKRTFDLLTGDSVILGPDSATMSKVDTTFIEYTVSDSATGHGAFGPGFDDAGVGAAISSCNYLGQTRGEVSMDEMDIRSLGAAEGAALASDAMKARRVALVKEVTESFIVDDVVRVEVVY